MSKTSSDSSATPLPPPQQQEPPPPHYRPTTAARRLASARIRHPSIIPLDYNYRTMAPSPAYSQQRSAQRPQRQQPTEGLYRARPLQTVEERSTSVDTTASEMDYQYSSLFGDPVPPAPASTTDFLSTQFDSPPLLRRTSAEGSSEEDGFGQTYTRLFPSTPYTSTATALAQRRYSIASASTTAQNGDGLSTTPMPMPRLQPPDIQILPNSSGGSSSETQDSPNFALLAPDDVRRESAVYDLSEPGDVIELTETVTINDARGAREYTEATRRVSSFAEDFMSNVGGVSKFLPTSATLAAARPQGGYARPYSEESYSSADWFRPIVPEFKMPRLRPSSKSVMAIQPRDRTPTSDSPATALINDSNDSSSGEERLLDATQVLERPSVSLAVLTPPPARPPNPSPSRMRALEMDLLRSRSNSPSVSPEYAKQRRKSSTGSAESNFMTPPPPPQPPPADGDTSPPSVNSAEDMDERDEAPSNSVMRGDTSPVILRDLVATGSDHRVIEPTRLHKKTSFSIISDRSAQSSRAQSPTPHPHKQTTSPLRHRDSTSSSSPTKPVAKPRYHLQRKSLTSMQLKLPQLALQPHQTRADDSQRPSVQFNMSGGRYTPSRMPQKGILHNRDSLTSSQDTLPQTTPTPPPFGPRGRSYEALPLLTDPYRTALPRLHRSHTDLDLEPAVIPPGALPRPLKPNPNPTRKQKGLLRIMPSGNVVTRIPLRSNWAASMEDLAAGRRRQSLAPLLAPPLVRRRSSSTSPERRSSTQTASDRRSSNLSTVTTSDFSFRRPSTSVAPLAQRRQSILPPALMQTPRRRQSLLPPVHAVGSGSASGGLVGPRTPRAKIAKPSPLSPIIGTPNKDSSTSQSPVFGRRAVVAPPSDTGSEATSRRNSVSSKIPVLSGSTSRLSSHADLRLDLHTNSPLKEFTAQLPLSSGLTSRATSSRSQSVANSRAPSRSTSRASTRPLSRGPPSRSGSRPNSRMEQAKDIANSRSNSRAQTQLSFPADLRAGSVSPNAGRRRGGEPIPSRRQSISLSPRAMRRKSGRAPSISPAKRALSKTPTADSGRRSARSRIPTRADSGAASARASPPKARTPSPAKQQAASRASPPRKPTTGGSAKKTPTSVRKAESSVRRTPSSVAKQATAAKKQPSNLQRSGSNLKRAATNLESRSATAAGAKPVRRELSSLSMKKTAGGGAAAHTAAATAGAKKPSSLKTPAKPATGKAAEKAKTGGSRPNTNPTIIASAEKPGTSGGTADGAGGMKRAASSLALLRMSSKISLLSKKRSDSSLSKRSLAAQPLAEQRAGAKPNDANAQMAAALTTQLNKLSSVGGGGGTAEDALPAAAILEKSQKTLETIQKTVTVATDEIHKTINENLTDLRTMEQDMGKASDSGASPTSSVATVVENRQAGRTGESVSRSGTAEGAPAVGAKKSTLPTAAHDHAAQKSPLPPTQPIEAAVSVLNAEAAAHTAAAAAAAATPTTTTTAAAAGTAAVGATATQAERNYELDVEGKAAAQALSADAMATAAAADGMTAAANSVSTARAHSEIVVGGAAAGSSAEDFKAEANRRSPDGQGGSTADSGEKADSQDFLDGKDEAAEAAVEQRRGCCSCCARFCMPCRRARCSQCCRRQKRRDANASDEAKRPVLSTSATSSATTTHLELIDETQAQPTSCWQKLNCCKRCCKKKAPTMSGGEAPTAAVDAADAAAAVAHEQSKLEAMREERARPPKQSKCGLCLSKVFCCRSVNKVEATSGVETQVKKCCFCIPCRRKKAAAAQLDTASGSAAWQDPEAGITATDSSVLDGAAAAPRQGCCRRFWAKLLCCRKKPPAVASDSRRQSIKAPPPAEDTRRKLHVDLVEYNSKMKGAIPVLPLYLAWFCAICNIALPGLGTLFSGLFCLCVGIPRFSQYDSAKARIGSFIINLIVAVSQLFCVLFCCVGWGWSIWWGTIMLRCARKLKKIRKVERLEMEEEKRQAEAAAAAAVTAARVAHNTEAETATTVAVAAAPTVTLAAAQA